MCTFSFVDVFCQFSASTIARCFGLYVTSQHKSNQKLLNQKDLVCGNNLNSDLVICKFPPIPPLILNEFIVDGWIYRCVPPVNLCMGCCFTRVTGA